MGRPWDLYQVWGRRTHKGIPDSAEIMIQQANERRFAMAGPVALRSDYDARALRRLAKASRDADQTRRLLAVAAIYDGSSRGDAAEIGGVGLQTVRDWVLRFNAEGPARLGNGKAPGGRPLLGEVERAALRQVVEAGPIPAIHGVVRWPPALTLSSCSTRPVGTSQPHSPCPPTSP